MQRKNRCIAFAAVLVFCLAAAVPAALAAVTAQLSPPEHVDSWMGAPTELHLAWSSGRQPAEGTNFAALAVRTVRAEGPEVAWGPVGADGVTGTVTLPGSPGARATYYYTVELMDGTERVGNPVGFSFDSFAPQITPLAGVQPISGATADVRVVWSNEAKPAEGTDFSKWQLVSEPAQDGMPEITWGALSAEGATGKLTVPPDAANGTKYEYRVEVQQSGQRVGNAATLTAVVERDDTAFAPMDPVTALPGTELTVDLTWQSAHKPQSSDLSSLRVVSRSDDENAPEIKWSAPTMDGVTGSVVLPADASGESYTYLVGAFDGDTQIGAGISFTISVWAPQLEDLHLNAAAGDAAEVTVGWSGDVVPNSQDLGSYTLKAASETGPETEWTLTAEGASATVQIPDDAPPETVYTYELTVLVDGQPAAQPATVTVTVLSAQLAAPQPAAAPPGQTTSITLAWAEDRGPGPGEDLTKWTVQSESTNGPAITWGPVTAEGVSGTVTMSPTAIAGVQYTYTVTLTSDGTAAVGEPVTLDIVVGDAIAAPITVEPEYVQIAAGAPSLTVTAFQDGQVAENGWWSLELGAPDGTSLETLGITDPEANPIEITATDSAPVGTYTLVYNKDTESGTMVIVIHVDDSEASLVTAKPDSGLAIERDRMIEEYLVVGIPISGRMKMYTPQMLLDSLETPEGMTLRLVDRAGQPVADTSAVATGMVLDVLNGDEEVAERLFTVVQGDVIGTGLMTLTQLVRMAQAFTGTTTLEPLYEIAGDFGGTGTITLSDLVRESRLLIEFS